MRNFSKSLLTQKILLGIILLSCLSSCYRMPTEDDYSVVPLTNNPDFTRARSNNNPSNSVNY